MINSFNAFVLSSTLFCFFTPMAQELEEPIQKVQYAVGEKLHARGLASTKKTIYIAASDGRLYAYNTRTKKSKVSEQKNTIEFRDIAVTRKYIIVMSSGDSSEITLFNRRLKNKSIIKFEGVFLDGFASAKNKIFLMGDPIEGLFSLFISSDFGKTWNKSPNSPEANSNEAAFAASGTTVHMINEREWFFVTGGLSSRIFKTLDAGQTWTNTELGYETCETCGANSIAILPNQRIVAVGGDFTHPNERNLVCRISNDCGKTWYSSQTEPNGYRSNILSIQGVLYTCGTNGIDVSYDLGETWIPFAVGNYYTMIVHENQLVASTRNGFIHFFALQKEK